MDAKKIAGIVRYWKGRDGYIEGLLDVGILHNRKEFFPSMEYLYNAANENWQEYFKIVAPIVYNKVILYPNYVKEDLEFTVLSSLKETHIHCLHDTWTYERSEGIGVGRTNQCFVDFVKELNPDCYIEVV